MLEYCDNWDGCCHTTTQKKDKPKKENCPECGRDTYIVSIFGSICSNEDCFYEPSKTQTAPSCEGAEGALMKEEIPNPSPSIVPPEKVFCGYCHEKECVCGNVGNPTCVAPHHKWEATTKCCPDCNMVCDGVTCPCHKKECCPNGGDHSQRNGICRCPCHKKEEIIKGAKDFANRFEGVMKELAEEEVALEDAMPTDYLLPTTPNHIADASKMVAPTPSINEIIKEILHDIIPHTPLKLEETNQTEYDKGYIFYQDIVIRNLKEVQEKMASLLTSFEANIRAEERERAPLSQIEKAIVALYKIVGMSQLTPDIVATANFMLKDYEQERRVKYVRHLEEKAHAAFEDGHKKGSTQERTRIADLIEEKMVTYFPAEGFNDGEPEIHNAALQTILNLIRGK